MSLKEDRCTQSKWRDGVSEMTAEESTATVIKRFVKPFFFLLLLPLPLLLVLGFPGSQALLPNLPGQEHLPFLLVEWESADPLLSAVWGWISGNLVSSICLVVISSSSLLSAGSATRPVAIQCYNINFDNFVLSPVSLSLSLLLTCSATLGSPMDWVVWHSGKLIKLPALMLL